MADHGSSGSQSNSHGYEAHRSTYQGFVTGSVALTIICGLVLVSLVAFRFVGSGNVLLGFLGLIIGILAVLIDVRAGKGWYLSGGVLLVFGLITAFAVS